MRRPRLQIDAFVRTFLKVETARIDNVRFPDRHGPGINESCTMKQRNGRGAVVHPKMPPITNEQSADSPQRTSWPGSSQKGALHELVCIV